MYDPNNPNAHEAIAKVGIEPTFFGKVMSFFALAMFSSAAGIFVAFRYLTPFFIQYPFMMYVLFAVELGIIFTSRAWSKKRPLNKFLFALFTFITGVTIMPLIALVIATPGGVPILFKALVATAFMFTATALVGWTTRFDLSGLRGFLMMGLIGMIVVGILGIFLPWGSTFELVFSGAGVLLFSGFTMYDFQKLKQFPEDRYIDAALMLYLDIFNLFLYILRFMLAISGRD